MGAWEQLVATPGDPAAARVWADALTEKGDPQGEAITLRCLLEELPPDDPRRPAFELRCERLEQAYGRSWVERLWNVPRPGDARGELFRGLPFGVAGQLPTILAAQHLALRPVASMFASWPQPDDIEALAATPGLKNVVDFSLHHLWGDLDLRGLFDSPHFGELRSLSLSGQKPGWAGPGTVGRLTRFTRLQRLVLRGFELDDTAAATLASGLPALTALQITGGSLTPAGVTALMDGAWTLHTLVLHQTGFGAAHLDALRKHPKAAALKVFDLAHGTLGKRAGAVLGELPLHTLRLASLDGMRPDWGAFLAGSAVARLKSLSLSGNPLKLEGAKLLAKATTLGGLEALDLSNCALGDGGAIELAKAKGLGALKSLTLRSNKLHKTGVPSLAKGPLLAPVETLDLTQNQFGNDGAKALGTSPHLGALRKLVLGHNGIDARGFRKLLANPALARLEELRVAGDNRLDSEMVLAFLKANAPRAFVHLDGQRVARADLVKLAASPQAAQLLELTLGCDDFDAPTAEALMASPHFDHLGTLQITAGGPVAPKIREALTARFGPTLIAPRV